MNIISLFCVFGNQLYLCLQKSERYATILSRKIMENKYLQAKELYKTLCNDKDCHLTEQVLSIAEDMNVDEVTRIAGALYLAFIHDSINENEIEKTFSIDVVNILKTLEKLDSLNLSQQKGEAENIRKMFFAITKDIQVIMLKIAFVVATLRESNEDNEEKFDFCRLILDLYAPLAARLGLSKYKTELEDKSFGTLYPKEYKEIETEVNKRYSAQKNQVESLTNLVQKCMADLEITGKVYGRKKHVYSIYKKLLNNKSLDKIYDLVAVRAIVKTVAECYALLGKLHGEVTPLQNRFKDYIAIPKSNGYQSLHTTVMFEGVPVEIQIRTEDMHKYAEFGVAAHWAYKEKRKATDSLDTKLAWIREMLDSDSTPEELASSLKVDIYNGEIFVQSPKGKVVHMPAGATPIDFAYNIHSDIGNKCVGAKINGKIRPTTTPLNNGDIVEIITSPNSKGPSRDWLKVVKTSEARNKINAFFKKNFKEDNIKLGKSMVEQAIKEKGYLPSKVITQEYLAGAYEKYNLTKEEELYAVIGAGSISAKSLANQLLQHYLRDIKAQQSILAESQARNISFNEPTDKQIDIKGLNNILIKFAGCCHPMPGDDIVGFVSTGRGIIIHRAICPNVSYFDESRLIEANWKAIPVKPDIRKSGKHKTPKKEN